MPVRPGRVVFVDLARAIAVLFMIQGHTLQVLLAPGHEGTRLFSFWLYLRGLTSCAFLTLSGLSFVLATRGYWSEGRFADGRVRRRLTRFGVFLLLGYAMHLPPGLLAGGGAVAREEWLHFAAVDILQLVGLTLAGLQAITRLTRTRRAFMRAALAGAALIMLATPVLWRVDWSGRVGLFAASYLSPETGSLFPAFPWAAYVLLGAGVGAWLVGRSADGSMADPSVPLLAIGAAMVAAGGVLHLLPFAPYGAIDFWKASPNVFLLKAGSVLVLLSAAARFTRERQSVPTLASILSRESLVVYFVHLCVLYGSSASPGLLHVVGPRLGLAPTIGAALLLMGAMSFVAWGWHECKRASFQLAVAVRTAVALALVYPVVL